MAIIKTVNFQDFERAFQDYNRENNFSYEGLKILFDYLEEISEDIGEPIELDVISLCCEYTEMDDVDVITYYNDLLDIDKEDLISGDVQIEDIVDRLNEYTNVLGYYYDDHIERDIIVFQQF